MDKPAGMTSHDVVARVRRVYQTRAVGHTGTLDPFATGLLVLLLGKGTRLARFVERRDKTYRAVARLGVTTDTDDATGGEVSRTAAPLPGEAAVREALAALVGRIEQRPPAFSAKHIGGERSYRKARRGEPVTLAPVAVTVHALDVLAWDGERVTFRARVSAGTYLRALARDLGESLGVGAHLVALRREAIGELRVEEAVPLASLDAATPLRPLRDVVAHLPTLVLDEAQWEEVARGRPLADAWSGEEATVILLHGEDVAAVAAASGGRLHPKVVLAAL